MAESIGVGLWKMVVFFYDFLVHVIFDSIVAVLFERTGLIVLGVLVVVAVVVFVMRRRR